MPTPPRNGKHVPLAVLASVLAHAGVAWLVLQAPVRHLRPDDTRRRPIEMVVQRAAPRPPPAPAPRPAAPPLRKAVKKVAEPARTAGAAPPVNEVVEPAPPPGGLGEAAVDTPSPLVAPQGTGSGGAPGAAGNGLQARPQLLLDTSSALRLVGGAQPRPEVPAALDEPEFKAAPFIARVRDVVASRWTPERTLDMRFDDGKLTQSGVSRSEVAVTIDRQGAIVRLDLVRRGKEDFLDELALAAVRASAPFINPPVGLFGPDGLYGFRVGVELTLDIPGLAEQVLGGPSLQEQVLEFATTGKKVKTMCLRRGKPCQPPACREKDLVVRGSYEPCARRH